MNRIQKIAWTLIIAISSGLILSCIAVAILYVKVGMPKAIAGFALMGIVGLAGFSPLIFRKDKGEITFDERDKLIKRRASLAGFGVFFICFFLEWMITDFIVGSNGLIRVRLIGMMFSGACLGMWAAWAVAILVQYGRGGEDGR